MLTKESIQAYIKAHESCNDLPCPFCGRFEVKQGDKDSGCSVASTTCRSCGKRWREYYTLTGIEEE